MEPSIALTWEEVKHVWSASSERTPDVPPLAPVSGCFRWRRRMMYRRAGSPSTSHGCPWKRQPTKEASMGASTAAMEVGPTSMEIDSSFSCRRSSSVSVFRRHCLRLSWKSHGSRLHPQKLLLEVEKSVGTLNFHGSIPFPNDFHGNRNHISRSVMRKASKGQRSARCMEQVDSSASVPAAAVVAAVSRVRSRVRRGIGGWERRQRRRRGHSSDCRAQDGKHTLSRIA